MSAPGNLDRYTRLHAIQSGSSRLAPVLKVLDHRVEVTLVSSSDHVVLTCTLNAQPAFA